MKDITQLEQMTPSTTINKNELLVMFIDSIPFSVVVGYIDGAYIYPFDGYGWGFGPDKKPKQGLKRSTVKQFYRLT